MIRKCARIVECKTKCGHLVQITAVENSSVANRPMSCRIIVGPSDCGSDFYRERSRRKCEINDIYRVVCRSCCCIADSRCRGF